MENSQSNEYVVYIHIFPNNKKYIGLTKNIKKRFRNGKGYQNSPRMERAIAKYGWKNVQTEILAKYLSKQEAQDLEIECIKNFKTTEQEFGYNSTFGGEGGNGRIMTDEQKAAIGRRFSEANKGRKMSDEQKAVISARFKGRASNLSEKGRQQIIERNRNYIYTPETRKKMSENTKKAMAEKNVSTLLKDRWNEDKDRRKAMLRLAMYNRYGVIPKKYDLRDDVLKCDDVTWYPEFDYTRDENGNFANADLFKNKKEG